MPATCNIFHKKPNLFILGASKAGTTSLHFYLQQHPNVFMSHPKEPRFFSQDSEYVCGMKHYLDTYFKQWNGQQCIGEADPDNLYLPYVPQRIYDLAPDAKLVIILRDPVTRAYSQWWMDYSAGLEKLSFIDAIMANFEELRKRCDQEDGCNSRLYAKFLRLRKMGILSMRSYLDRGYYAIQIKRYQQLFSESQIKVIFLEDLISEPKKGFLDVCRFLGLKNTPDIDLHSQNVAFNSLRVSRAFYYITRTISRTRLPRLIRTKRLITVWLNLWKPLSGVGVKPTIEKEANDWLNKHYTGKNEQLKGLLKLNRLPWTKIPTTK